MEPEIDCFFFKDFPDLPHWCCCNHAQCHVIGCPDWTPKIKPEDLQKEEE